MVAKKRHHQCWKSAPAKLLCDLFRVTLHEFGHVLGLDHPDQAGQTVKAIMNSRVSDVDNLTTDDVYGAQALYPTLSPVITATLQLESASSPDGTLGRFQLKMTGLENREHIIQMSADLASWVSLTTNSVTNGELHFTDTNLVGASSRFYRALPAP